MYAACSVPDHEFNDVKYKALTQGGVGGGDSLGGSGGTDALGGTSGTAGTGASAGTVSSTGGTGGAGATAGTGGSSGKGGSPAGTGGGGAMAGTTATGGAGATAGTSSGGAGASGAGGSACSHDPCVAGAALDMACSKCAMDVCSQFPSCCTTQWGSLCTQQAKTSCAACGSGGMGGAGNGGGGNGGGGGPGGGGTGGAATGGGGAGTGGGAAGNPNDCMSSIDCPAGQFCNKTNVGTMKISCSPGGAGSAKLGEACIGNGSCATGLCDSYAKTCSVACNSAAECGTGNVCVETFVGSQTWLPNTCKHACSKDGDCPSNAVAENACLLDVDQVDQALLFACDSIGAAVGTQGIKGFGSIVNSAMGEACYNLFSFGVPGPNPPAGNYCSRACATNADCAAPFPNCSSVQFMTSKPPVISSFVKICTQ